MQFDKFVAAGNDFIIFNGMEDSRIEYRELALKVCDRHFGIGADGLMICKKSDVADIKMLYFNSDGSQGEMCGNGIRSFSKYIYDYKIINKKDMSVETLDGIKQIAIEIDGLDKANMITVDMGYPVLKAEKIPIDLNKEKIVGEIITIDEKRYEYSALLVGVPHVVIFIEYMDELDINDLGKKIENHPLFPKRTNVNFVEVIDHNNINIYTWERGAGRTLGCGTGSCASVVIGNMLNVLSNKVNVNTEGGNLTVELKENYKIYMTGSANHIAKGEFYFQEKLSYN